MTCVELEKLAERVADMRAWAESRIRYCKEAEAQLSADLVQAKVERRSLEAVLHALDGKVA